MPKTSLSVNQSARYLNCTVNYVFQMLWAGRLAGAEKRDGRWHIPLSALDAYKKEQQLREGR